MRKLASLFLAIVMVLSCLCVQAGFSGVQVKASDIAEENYWPAESDKVELTYWGGLSSNASASMTSLEEALVIQKMEELTGIHMTFQHPVELESDFNMMMVSGDFPDIIEYSWITKNPKQYIEDDVIIALNDVLEQFAPDALAAMTQNDSLTRQCTTSDGLFYAFCPVISYGWSAANANTKDTTQCGPYVREDWIVELGLEDPKTWDEWTTVLTAFKEQKGATAPLTSAGLDQNFFKAFAGVYDTCLDYYQKDGTVVYGPMTDNYKEFLKAMSKWYADGLYDPDFASNDGNTVKTNILNGISGATTGFSGGGISTNINAMIETNPDFDLRAVQYPMQIDGSEPEFMHYAWPCRNSGQAAISTACENVEYAAKYLNYFYSEEGRVLKNFGIEGLSYEVDENGNINKTEILTKNPDGLSGSQAMAKYTFNDVPHPGYVLKTLEISDQRATIRNNESLDIWFPMSANTLNTLINQAAVLNEEEQAIVGGYATNITTYMNEMAVKFIMGTADIDAEWDGYIDQLKALHVEDVIAQRQSALDRFNG